MNELRVVFFEKWKVVPESATINNILLDYDIKTDQEDHLKTLCGAIKKAGGLNTYFWHFCLLSDNFMQYLYKSTKDSVYIQRDCTRDSGLVPVWDDSDSELDDSTDIEADYTQNSESVGEDTTDTTEHSNYQEPLSKDEMKCLLEDLTGRHLNAGDARTHSLKNLGISRAGRGRNIIVDSNERVHFLLTRLYNTKRDWFKFVVKGNDGYYDISNTSVRDIKIKLERYNLS